MSTVSLEVVRLQVGDGVRAKDTFHLMADVFDENYCELSDAYVTSLLARPEFWAYAAVADGVVVGGLTAHTLPITSSEQLEVFLYDIAVSVGAQRQGIGRKLVERLLTDTRRAGIAMMFVAADNEDVDALDFYRSLGGRASRATIFEFDN